MCICVVGTVSTQYSRSGYASNEACNTSTTILPSSSVCIACSSTAKQFDSPRACSSSTLSTLSDARFDCCDFCDRPPAKGLLASSDIDGLAAVSSSSESEQLDSRMLRMSCHTDLRMTAVVSGSSTGTWSEVDGECSAFATQLSATDFLWPAAACGLASVSSDGVALWRKQVTMKIKLAWPQRLSVQTSLRAAPASRRPTRARIVAEN